MIVAGVIDAVVAILQANLDHTSVQAHGIACLANVACHNDASRVWTVLVWVVTIPRVF